MLISQRIRKAEVMNNSDPIFPTRQFPYRKPNVGMAGLESASPVPSHALSPNTIYRFVLGLDAQPSPMSSEDVDQYLRDPFGKGLLSHGRFAMTLQSLLVSPWNRNSQRQQGRLARL